MGGAGGPETRAGISAALPQARGQDIHQHLHPLTCVLVAPSCACLSP